MEAIKAVEAPQGDKCEMLCHESECLDGDKPDRECIGFKEATK